MDVDLIFTQGVIYTAGWNERILSKRILNPKRILNRIEHTTSVSVVKYTANTTEHICPYVVRKVPEIFCLSFTMCTISRSA